MKKLKLIGLGFCAMLGAGLLGGKVITGNTLKANAFTLEPVMPLGANAQKADRGSNKIKIALLLDTSNSMDGLIDQAKSQLWNIVNELAKAKAQERAPELEIAVYQYGNDNLSGSEGFIRQETAFTGDLDMVSEKLFGLSTRGGSEFCGQAIFRSLKDLNWGGGEADYKAIFIAGNESFDQGEVSRHVALNLAKSKDVFVNAIFCGNGETGISQGWNAVLQSAIGAYLSIDSDQKTVYIATPYDQQISALNAQLNDTYVWYGADGQRAYTNMNVQDRNAQEYGTSNMVNRALSKNSQFYRNRNDSWDLVDKITQDPGFKVSSVKAENLPEELRKMKPDVQMEYVLEKKRQREQINAQLDQLGKSRETFLAREKARSGQEGSLEQAMLSAVREQARSKGFTMAGPDRLADPAPEFVASLVDFDYFMEVAAEVRDYRKDRLVDFNQFLLLANTPKTIILDTRSKEHFDAMHIRGAIHLNFSGFNVYDLARLIPDKNTRILIYCNNNIDTDTPAGFEGIRSKAFERDVKRALVSKASAPIAVTNEMVLKREPYTGAGLDDKKTLALNIPTFITLYGYGYENIYELSELVRPNDPRLVLEGTAVAPALGSR